MDWLGQELGYSKMEDWYKLTKQLIIKNYGGRLLDKYNDSPYKLLKDVFPNYDWKFWMFDSTYLGAWNDKKNIVKYMNWLEKKLGYTKMENWFKLTHQLIHDNYGGGLLISKYNGSSYQLLKDVFSRI